MDHQHQQAGVLGSGVQMDGLEDDAESGVEPAGGGLAFDGRGGGEFGGATRRWRSRSATGAVPTGRTSWVQAPSAAACRRSRSAS
ncbi:hypothetical protein [Kitasatospora cheerisanensis]|uniref:hypothetical protein n=1 Tax=Kitasatospora cheerisanensis TaxID=81942 RepID=UPI00143057C9|nr:hypothetical protein [Kitasatospora cheerisanensis]